MRSICKLDGCDKQVAGSGWCRLHYDRVKKHGDPLKAKKQGAHGSGYRRRDGRLIFSVAGRKVYEHILVAETALGKPLPPGAEVHHVDENKGNNLPSNLVVCPDAAYHKLLHQRQRAFDACGHYDWRKCQFCKVYDSTRNGMWFDRKKAFHLACERVRKHARRAASRRAILNAHGATLTEGT